MLYYILRKSTIFKTLRIGFHSRHANRNVKAFKFIPPLPRTVNNKEAKIDPSAKIDQETIELLERLSLVGFGSSEGVKIVESAIAFADQIFEVNTDNVKPLITVLEDEPLYLREDIVEQDSTAEEILSNSSVTLENYFITPPGNIPCVLEKTPTVQERSENNSVSKKDQISMN